MEDDEKDYIMRNSSDLLNLINCSATLLVRLNSLGSLSFDETDLIETLPTAAEKNKRLLSILTTRRLGFLHLKSALEYVGQSGAHLVLKNFPGLTTYGPVLYDKRKILVDKHEFKVYKGEMQFRKLVAVKVVKLTTRDKEMIVREFKMLSGTPSHSNLLQCWFAEQISCKKKIIAVLEIWRADLEECVVKNMYPVDRANICRQLIAGIQFLHTHKIIHGNLMPTNILVVETGANNPVIKLSKFGQPINWDHMFVESHKYCWLPPEILVFIGKPIAKRHVLTCKTDSFVLGMVFFYVLTDGRHPFGDMARCSSNIVDGNYVLLYQMKETIHEAIYHLPISKMLHHDAAKRPSCNEILKLVKQADILPDVGHESCRGLGESLEIQSYMPENDKRQETSSMGDTFGIFSVFDRIGGEDSLYEVQYKNSKSTKHGNFVYKTERLVAIEAGTEIYEGKTQNGHEVTVKKRKLNNGLEDFAVTEVEKWRSLKEHPNIARILNASIVKERHLVFVLESSGYTLEECVRTHEYPLPRPHIFMYIAKGLHFLHSNLIVHGKLQPSSVVIQQTSSSVPTIKLSDYMFNYPKEINPRNVYWIAPEMIWEENSSIQNGHPMFATDIFSFGCMIFYLLTEGIHPFGTAATCQMNMLNGKFSLQCLKSTSWEFRYETLISSMISAEPSVRPSSENVAENCSKLSKIYAVNQEGNQTDVGRIPAVAGNLILKNTVCEPVMKNYNTEAAKCLSEHQYANLQLYFDNILKTYLQETDEDPIYRGLDFKKKLEQHRQSLSKLIATCDPVADISRLQLILDNNFRNSDNITGRFQWLHHHDRLVGKVVIDALSDTHLLIFQSGTSSACTYNTGISEEGFLYNVKTNYYMVRSIEKILLKYENQTSPPFRPNYCCLVPTLASIEDRYILKNVLLSLCHFYEFQCAYFITESSMVAVSFLLRDTSKPEDLAFIFTVWRDIVQLEIFEIISGQVKIQTIDRMNTTAGDAHSYCRQAIGQWVLGILNELNEKQKMARKLYAVLGYPSELRERIHTLLDKIQTFFPAQREEREKELQRICADGSYVNEYVPPKVSHFKLKDELLTRKYDFDTSVSGKIYVLLRKLEKVEEKLPTYKDKLGLGLTVIQKYIGNIRDEIKKKGTQINELEEGLDEILTMVERCKPMET